VSLARARKLSTKVLLQFFPAALIVAYMVSDRTTGA